MNFDCFLVPIDAFLMMYRTIPDKGLTAVGKERSGSNSKREGCFIKATRECVEIMAL